MKNKLQYLVIHCTATPEGRKVTADEIHQWHQGPRDNSDGTVTYKGHTFANRQKLPNEKIGGIDIEKLKGRGWRQVGYADMILLDGTVQNLVPYNNDDIVDPWEVTNGALGVNGVSRHLVYVGGMNKEFTRDEDTRTSAQRDAMKLYLQKTITQHPDILIAGHNQFQKKACPSFKTADWCRANGIPAHNICTLPIL